MIRYFSLAILTFACTVCFSKTEAERILEIRRWHSEIGYHTAEAIKALIPLIEYEIANSNTAFLDVFFGEEMNYLPRERDAETEKFMDILKKYPPYLVRQISHLTRHEVEFIGTWSLEGVDVIHKALLQAYPLWKVQTSGAPSEGYYSYLDRVLVVAGETFSYEKKRHQLPNPEAVLGLKFDVYFFDGILTVPPTLTAEELTQQLGTIPPDEWISTYSEDKKRLPGFFSERILAARDGYTSEQWYCQKILANIGF